MLMTNGNLYQPGMRRRTLNRQVTFGPVTLRVVTIVIFAVAAFIALAQSTASATNDYRKTRLEDERDVLQGEVNDLKIQEARHKALSAVMSDSLASPSPSPVLEEPKEINALPPDFDESIISHIPLSP